MDRDISSSVMQTDPQKKKPMRTKKKSDGWREREESKAAGVTPRPTTSDEPRTIVEHVLVRS